MEVKKKNKKSWRKIVEEYYWDCGGAYPWATRKAVLQIRSELEDYWTGLLVFCVLLRLFVHLLGILSFPGNPFSRGKGRKGLNELLCNFYLSRMDTFY